MRKILLSLSLFCIAAFAQIETPTMGWSSWNTFLVDINEDLIKGQAAAMVSSGLKDAGYMYINIDDGFQGGRDENGKLKTNPTRFPNGLKPVSDYIHSLGLKAGIYSDAGSCTCGSLYNGDVLSKNVGFYGHDQQDADFYFLENEFDFIKVDYCGGIELNLNEQERYTAISNAIKNTGRDVRYNLCRWAYPGTWCHDISTSWRTTGDISCSWESVKGIIAENLYMSAYCYDGCYNDMDMLEVGRTLSEEEDKTHFGMWCIMDSPLLIGCNLQTLNERTLKLLTNKDLVAINQDPLGLQAYVAQYSNNTYVLAKDIIEKNSVTRAVALYNPTEKERLVTISFDALELAGNVKVHDCFEQQYLGILTDGLAVEVPAHGCRIYRLEAEKRQERYLYEGETAYLSEYQEISNNEAVGSAVIEGSSAASGEKYVGWLGNKATNDLVWRDVYSAEGGEYTARFSCGSQESRSFIVEVNGEKAGTINVSTGAWQTFKEYGLKITLQPGENTIRLYNASSWMPNIDYMELHSATNDNVNARKLQAVLAQLKVKAEASSLPHGFEESVDNLLAEGNSENLTDEQRQDITNRAVAMLSTIDQVVEICTDFAIWKANAEKNIRVSVESDACTTLTEKMTTAEADLNASSTLNAAKRALNALKTALKSYLRSEASKPKDGESLDMTLLITNYDFSTETGWSGNPTYRSGCGEAYDKAFDVYQTLASMKPGVYTVSVNALYRTTDNDGGKEYRSGKEVIPALFYANNDSQTVLSLYSYNWKEASEYGSVDNLNGFPHSMYAAGTCFAQGAYLNTLTISLESKGTIRIGLKSDEYKTHNWCCFDNFSITYQPLPTADNISVPQSENITESESICYDLQGRKTAEGQRGIVLKDGKAYLCK